MCRYSPAMTTREVALYCRLSPRPDGSYEGVDEQEAWGRSYAAERWPGVPVRVFRDAGRSAFHDDARPDYDALRAAVAVGAVAHLWAVEQSRLERREVEWFQLAALLDGAGITELHTNRDGVVRVRDAVAGIKAVINAEEIRKLRRRVMDKQDVAASDGRPPGAMVFGYRHCTATCLGHPKTLHVVPAQSEAIRWAAERALAGWSLANLCRTLTEAGHIGARGGPLTPSKVRKILCNPTVAGLRVHRGVITGRGNWPAILDENTRTELRRRFEAPRIVTRSDGRSHSVGAAALSSGRRAGRKYTLTGGLARCGLCGSALVGTAKQFRSGTRAVVVPYLLCPLARGGCGRIGITLPATEQHVADQLLDEIDTPAFRAAVAADEHASARKAATAELAACEGQREEFAAMWAQGSLTSAEWAVGRQGLDTREDAARAALAATPPPLAGVDVDAARQAWPSMTLDERREFLRLFIASVVIAPARPGTRRFDGGRVTVEFLRG